MARITSKSEGLYIFLQPLACKTSGDGACGLHAVTHSIADLCRQAEENEKIMPNGDADIAKRYQILKRRLEERVLPYYKKLHPDTDIDDFMIDFITASPDRLEDEFSPHFRDLMAEHIAQLPAPEFEHLKDELNNKAITREQYLANLRAIYPNNWFNNKELGYILEALNLRGRLYVVNKENNIKQFPFIGSPRSPEDALYAGDIGLVNYPERHWEWLASNAETAALHNKAHHGAKLYFGEELEKSTKPKSPDEESKSKMQKMPEMFKGVFDNMGITEGSDLGKAFATLMNFVMGFLGIFRNLSLQVSPDQPFDAAELQMPGAKEIEKASKALGEDGQGLHAAFRNAKTPELQETLLRDVIKRLADKHEYALADELLQKQEAELLKAAHQVDDNYAKVDPASAASGMVHEVVETCENVLHILAKDELFSMGSDNYKRESFEERLNMLKEGWNIQQNAKMIVEPGAVLKTKKEEALKEMNAALKKMETIRLYTERSGKAHPGRQEAEAELSETRTRMAAVDAEIKAFENTSMQSLKSIMGSVDKIRTFIPAHEEHIATEREKLSQEGRGASNSASSTDTVNIVHRRR